MHSQPLSSDSPAITGWATRCFVNRGFINIADTTLTDQGSNKASSGMESNATGKADMITVSLGDGGSAVLSFDEAIINHPGADIAFFENGISGDFLELAFVDVSSDSISWVQFPAVSETQTNTQIETFGTMDGALLKNLAGKNLAGYGTTFDLVELADSQDVDINNIRFIRITDVVGSVNPLYGSKDSQGNMINDPWPTPFFTSGFDLDAVALLNMSLDIPDESLFSTLNISLHPNPCREKLIVSCDLPLYTVRIVDARGSLVFFQTNIKGTKAISFDSFPAGLYLLTIQSQQYQLTRSIIKIP